MSRGFATIGIWNEWMRGFLMVKIGMTLSLYIKNRIGDRFNWDKIIIYILMYTVFISDQLHISTSYLTCMVSMTSILNSTVSFGTWMFASTELCCGWIRCAGTPYMVSFWCINRSHEKHNFLKQQTIYWVSLPYFVWIFI